MQTITSLQAFLASAPETPAVRFVPPAHVKRWTGRSTPTILLPNLAALRLGSFEHSSARSGAGRN